jgi:acetyl-CoA C-acetyltransferase
MLSKKIVILEALRTPMGRFGGSLASLSPVQLAVPVARKLLSLLPGEAVVDELILGSILTAGHGMNIARQIALAAGLPQDTPAVTINQMCGSGLRAITLAAERIASGGARLILAGGSESMSQSPYLVARPGGRTPLGHMQMLDSLLRDGLEDSFGHGHMACTAETLAQECKISRTAQDEFALSSQARYAAAHERGVWADEIVPLQVTNEKRQAITVAEDEHPRPDTTLERLASLKPAFTKDGTITAGNASGINDGAALALVADADYAANLGVEALGVLTGFTSVGVDPARMGLGPVAAMQRLEAGGALDWRKLDLVELNEAFAAQALACLQQWPVEPSRVNVNGGAIALGHPIGASGARIVATLLHQMRRQRADLGAATLCAGGGMGVAALFSRA